jgi:hypothetical protein
MTVGEIITNVLTYYVNQGSSTVQQDSRQRQKAHFFFTQAARRLWNSAPYWFRKGDGTVSLTAGVGTLPTDFSRMGTQGQVYIQGQLYRPLSYKAPDWMKFQIKNSPQTGTPRAYSLYDTTASVRAQGLQEILCWPSDNSTLDVLAYDKKMVEMIDRPLAPVATLNAVAGNLTGAYYYAVTFVTARGETEGGFVSNTVTTSAERMSVSGIPTWWGSTVTSRKLYRTAGGGTQLKLLDTIADNTTTTYADNTADGSLGANIPTVSDGVSGAETFPSEFHDSSLYDGLKYLFADAQGDGRDDKFFMKWTREVQRMWEEHQQGQNEIQAFRPFPGFTSGHPVWGRWTPPS